MAGKWWIGIVLVVAAASSPRAAPAQQADTRPTSQPAGAGDYVDRLSRSLGEGTPAARYEAAQRLVNIERLDARAAITRALNGTDLRARTAAARAAADAPSPDAAWVTPLATMLDRETNAENADYAAVALSRFDEDPRAFDALIRVSRSKQPGQLPAVNALGRVVQKRVAATLLGLMNDPNEMTAVHEAAADALSRISPQTSRAIGNAAWTRWWDERNALADQDWRSRVIAEQHRFLELADARAADRLTTLRQALYQSLYNQYEQQQPNVKSDFLKGLLNNPDSDVRAVGAKIVPVALTAAQILKQDVWDRLENLLGDASPDVRLSAAAALENRRDTNVFSAVVLQLRVENDLRVKRALVQILGRMDPQAALPVLKGLLNDPSEAVAAAAAEALASLAPSLNPQARKDLFDTIRQTLIDRTGPPGQPIADASVDLRASIILALGASADWSNAEGTVPIFQQLINERSATVRQAAVRALAPAGRVAGRTLSERLNPTIESDPNVRRAAAISLGSMTSFEWANWLMDSTRPAVEPVPAVRDAAWQSLQKLLRYGEHDDLSRLAREFKDRREPERRLVVQRVIAEKTPDLRSKAMELQTAGDISMDDLKRPPEAVLSYREALRFYRQLNTYTPLTLVKSLLRAYLASNQIQEAMNYCKDQIQLEKRTQATVGQTLAETAEMWADSKNPADWEKARQLVSQAVSLDLEELFKDRLNRIKLPASPSTRPTTNPVESSRTSSLDRV